MIVKKRSLSILPALCAAALLVLTLAACSSAPSTEKTVAAGTTWEVPEVTSLTKLTIAEGADIKAPEGKKLSLMVDGVETPVAAGTYTGEIVLAPFREIAEITRLTELTIAEGEVIKAPEGKNLTLTIDGVESPIAAGTYTGDIVLTPTEDIPVSVSGMATITYHFRTAVYIEDGKYVPEKSVGAAVVGGTVTDTAATSVSITSVNDKFNGIIVTGDEPASYSIDNPVINLTGNGMNDFAGYGAAIMTEGKAEVTIDNAKINNTGVVRTAVWVGGDSTTTINDSEIEVKNGTMPEDYGWSWTASKSLNGRDVMMEVPWMLGLVGNCRATNVLANGTANYNNTHIKAQAWGVLSTDACRNTTLNATGCHLETVESGYGSYADGATNTFSDCVFDINDYGLIMTNGSGTFTDGTVVNSGRFGVMSHRGSGTVTIDKGSVFNTKKAVLQVKSGTPTFIVDGAELNSESGVLFEAILNDDPNTNFGGGGATTSGDGVTSGGMGGPGDRGGAPGSDAGMPGGRGEMPEGGMPGGAPGGDMAGGGRGEMPEGGGPGGMPEGGMPGGGAPGAGMPEGGGSGGAPGGMQGGGMPPGGAGGSGVVTVVYRNTTLTGDTVTSMTSESDVEVSLENTTLTGAITTATAVHSVGPNGEELVMQDDPSLYKLIGAVEHTYAATEDEHGIKVTLDGSSTWVVDKTSYLTGLTIAEGAVITAPVGGSVTMTVNGAETPVAAGTYEGKIVLSIPGA